MSDAGCRSCDEAQAGSGPIEAADLPALLDPPELRVPRLLQEIRLSQRQFGFVCRAKEKLGDVVRLRGTTSRPGSILVSNPEDVRSLFTARPDELSTYSAALVKQVVGPDSILTSTGSRYMRQRKLLLPSFHGDAIEEYGRIVATVTDREMETWPLNQPFPLAQRLQAIALDVILAGIFGIIDAPAPRTSEGELRAAILQMVRVLSRPLFRLNGLISRKREHPNRLTRSVLDAVDRPLYEVIRERRLESDRSDILALLLRARTEEGEGLEDKELRDELISLLLAGHETTANSLAWTWERLLRHRNTYDDLRDVARGDTPDRLLEATLIEGMRCRPVIPMLGRTVDVPWRFGPYGVHASTHVVISVLLLHHREDLYSTPFDFRPQRWLDRQPGAYEWIAFGGGIRRCLGSALAITEQRIILGKMARCLDLEPDDPTPERPIYRVGTMIPASGGRVVLRHRQGEAA
jgi:cytochrome P450